MTRHWLLWLLAILVAVLVQPSLSLGPPPAQASTSELTTIVGCDPVSGRNQEFILAWEQVSLATRYDLLIYKGDRETLWAFIVVDLNTSEQMLKPRYTFAAGQTMSRFPFSAGSSDLGAGSSSPAQVTFECGHTYWWQVRVSGTAYERDIIGPYSDFGSIVVKAGLPALLVFAPESGAFDVPVTGVTFTWAGMAEASEYQFELAEDAAMTRILADQRVPTTAYTYDRELKYYTSYFWRVMATKPAASEWSPVFTFTTGKAPPPLSASPAPPPPSSITPPSTPDWGWLVIGLGVALAILALILIIRSKRI